MEEPSLAFTFKKLRFSQISDLHLQIYSKKKKKTKTPTQQNPEQPWSHLESANPDHFPPNDCLLHSPFKCLAALQIFLLFLSPTHPSWQPSWARTNLRRRKLSTAFSASKSSASPGKSWALFHFQGKNKISKLSKPRQMRAQSRKIKTNQKSWGFSRFLKPTLVLDEVGPVL